MEQKTRYLSIDDVRSLINKSPAGRLNLWIVYFEDVYEARFGDGSYFYPGKACYDRDTAEKWAAWVAENSKADGALGFNTEVRQVDATINYAAKICLQVMGEELIMRDPESKILDLLNGTDSDWQSIVEVCHRKIGSDGNR
ncbi:MAG: hypothetical protein ACD_39C00673G0003 [uncultured bacterium]|nr:MAG: hypothetical protein ACD_39C00673G0003 [uncultured bacterium]